MDYFLVKKNKTNVKKNFILILILKFPFFLMLSSRKMCLIRLSNRSTSVENKTNIS